MQDSIVEFPSALISTNHCPMTAVDVETTGTVAGYHEICEMAWVPLDSELEPTGNHFYMRVRPDHPERADPDSMRVHGITMEELMMWPNARQVEELWEEWFQNLNLPLGKKLAPLAHNWKYEAGFIESWLGITMMKKRLTLPRDTLRAMAYQNDRACFHCQQLPWSSMTLESGCEKLGIPLDGHHNALQDAIATARIYKELLRMG